MAIVGGILVLRAVAVDCTSEFELDEDNPSELLIFVERLGAVQNGDGVWELLTVELFANEEELQFETIVADDG